MSLLKILFRIRLLKIIFLQLPHRSALFCGLQLALWKLQIEGQLQNIYKTWHPHSMHAFIFPHSPSLEGSSSSSSGSPLVAWATPSRLTLCACSSSQQLQQQRHMRRQQQAAVCSISSRKGQWSVSGRRWQLQQQHSQAAAAARVSGISSSSCSSSICGAATAAASLAGGHHP